MAIFGVNATGDSTSDERAAFLRKKIKKALLSCHQRIKPRCFAVEIVGDSALSCERWYRNLVVPNKIFRYAFLACGAEHGGFAKISKAVAGGDVIQEAGVEFFTGCQHMKLGGSKADARQRAAHECAFAVLEAGRDLGDKNVVIEKLSVAAPDVIDISGDR